MHFHVAKTPVMPFTMTASLAAGDPLPQIFALAGLSSIPKDEEVLVFPANFPPLIRYLHWKWHSTQHAVEFPLANLFSGNTQEIFCHDWKHLMPPQIQPPTLPMQSSRQQTRNTQPNMDIHNSNNLFLCNSMIDTATPSLQFHNSSKLFSLPSINEPIIKACAGQTAACLLAPHNLVDLVSLQ